MADQRTIIHCDCDCFYAAVEMRDHPQWQNRPLAVGGRSDRRGVISTCNYQARQYGVHSAMPTAKAKQLCPELIVVPGRMDVYKAVSAKVRQIFERYTKLIEPLSLDEAYLDVTDSPLSAKKIAEGIRQSVRMELGITISAGIAPNKFLAKIASDWQKPDGLTVISPAEVDEFVANLPVNKIMGVGKVTAQRMASLELRTCKDIRQKTDAFMFQHFGKFGMRLKELSHGIDKRTVKTDRRRKSLTVERTFDHDLTDIQQIEQSIDRLYVEFLQRSARLDKFYQPAGLVLKMKFNDFRQTTVESHELKITPDSFYQLAKMAWERGKKPIRLIGLGMRLRDLKQVGRGQLSLF